MSQKKRVLIIAIDGFASELAGCLIAENIMPNLANIAQKGCHGILTSVTPCETSPAWSSFQTGCYPGKTGVFAFHTYDRNKKHIRLNSFADIAVPSIWHLADRAGKTIVSINMPLTSPPPPVKGVIIPGLLCPSLSPSTVQPPEAYNKYIKPHPDYKVVDLKQNDSIAKIIQRAIETEELHCRVALDIMKDVDWDIFCLEIQSTDRIQHKSWNILNPSNKDADANQRKQALTFYQFCDEIIGKIIRAAGSDALTLIVSDHGFCELECSFNINTWLRHQGYLQLLPKEIPTTWSTIKDQIPPLKFLAKTYGNLKKKVPAHKETRPLCESMLDHIRRTVDLENTKALALGGLAGLIYINELPQQQQQTATRITDQLITEFGPESDSKIIAAINPGDKLYGGRSPYLPDLVVQYKKGVSSRLNPSGTAFITTDEATGTHSYEGFFAANGPGVKTDTKLNSNIIDITPTILAYLGIPIPEHMDGKVLHEVFTQTLRAEYEHVEFDHAKSTKYSDDEQTKVEQQLSDLGYL